MLFDPDPPPGPNSARQFGAVRRGALLVRDLLETELGLTAFVKTTGGHGLHVHVPPDGKADFDAARRFARGVESVLADRTPDGFTHSTRVTGRPGPTSLVIPRHPLATTVLH